MVDDILRMPLILFSFISGHQCVCSQVDAIANSIGGDFNLKNGVIAKNILKRAGPKIQKALTSNKPKSINYGDVVTTGGFDLNCRYVFHGVCKAWNDGKDDAETVNKERHILNWRISGLAHWKI